MATDISTTERELIDCAAAIGGIYGCNGHYTQQLARMISQNGLIVSEMTVGQLIQLHNECNQHYNEMYK